MPDLMKRSATFIFRPFRLFRCAPSPPVLPRSRAAGIERQQGCRSPGSPTDGAESNATAEAKKARQGGRNQV